MVKLQSVNNNDGIFIMDITIHSNETFIVNMDFENLEQKQNVN